MRPKTVPRDQMSLFPMGIAELIQKHERKSKTEATRIAETDYPELRDRIFSPDETPHYLELNFVTQIKRDLRVLKDTTLSTFDREFYQERVNKCKESLKKVVDSAVVVVV